MTVFGHLHDFLHDFLCGKSKKYYLCPDFRINIIILIVLLKV